MVDLKIQMEGHGRGRVFINGNEIEGVVTAEISVGVDKINSASLTLTPKTINVIGPFCGHVETTSMVDGERTYSLIK